jgi:anaerobic magnesium-protoporphyrin IX monomethyl ester cyclase
MSRVAIIKIHPGLNMALPQLAGDLKQAGHEARMYFFKDYKLEEQYFESSFSEEKTNSLQRTYDHFEPEYDLLANELVKFKPDAIGLSVISLSIPEAIKTTQFLRSKFDLPIIWGGVGTTLQPEIAIESADMVCVGEGEGVLVEFANRLQQNIDWSSIEGTWVKTPAGEVIKNAKRPTGSLDNIAIPDWDISKMFFITANRIWKNKAAFNLVTSGDYQIMTQRGCPFSCSFCVESRYQEMFGKKNSLRRRSVDLVIEELVIAKEMFNPRVLWFWDDVFTVNPRWLKEFLPKYKEKVGIPFWCYTYPTTHNLELLKDLKEAGCNCISMGIQSGSERVLKEVYNRPTPLDRVIEASQEIVDAGLHGYFDLISKSAFETEADLRSTFEFLVDLPQEMNYGGIGEMKSYPTYSYTKKEESANEGNIVTSLSTVDDKTYDYYHKLYWVARNPFISKQEKLIIGQEPAFRDKPELLEQFFYGVRSVLDAIFQMRGVTEKGEHPNKLFPPPAYVHKSVQSVA